MSTSSSKVDVSFSGKETSEIYSALLEESSNKVQSFLKKSEVGKKLLNQMAEIMKRIHEKKENRGVRNTKFDAQSPETARFIVHEIKEDLVAVCEHFGFLLKIDYLSDRTATGMICYSIYLNQEEKY